MTSPKYSRADWDEVSDSPELTAEQIATARPFGEAFPEIAARMRRARGKQKAPTKVSTTLRLDEDVIAKFKADGPGWQSRMNEALRAAAGF
ncbi:MAG: BrnA antitoxin family protein [Sphingopyxis sp.]|uniref:BrnA antitoxin family protein n=1 Tax=Sphingopyxis sp. TaxID=1908224 RepID=UPI001A3E8F05|nr:BrnA antitoxin family protein [Sphingopyxis sp.]MBL9070260.1 BrnA antitoxin family protein [Sphingopyxis sp.]